MSQEQATALPDGDPPAKMTLTRHGSGASAVVEVRWARAVDGAGRVDAAAVQTMLAAAMAQLTGFSWTDLATGGKKIGVKVNTIKSQAFTHPELASAIALGLTGAGASPGNVTVWDRDTFGLSGRGYSVDPTGTGGFRCLGSDQAAGEGKVRKEIVAGHTVSLSPLLDAVDHLINVAALKDHSMAGVTLSLKNNFGLIHSAQMLHGKVDQGSGCEPGISQLAACGPVKGKARLAVLDALVGVCQGGPGPAEARHTFRHAGILVTRDPVALDRAGLKIIETRRAALGLEPVAERRSPNPSPTEHIDNAAALGVGPA